MRYVILPIVLALVALRVGLRLRSRARARSDVSDLPTSPRSRLLRSVLPSKLLARLSATGGGIGLVAWREVRERVKGRVFRVGTIIVLLAVAAAVVIPTLNKGQEAHEHIGIVGSLAVPQRATIAAIGTAIGTRVTMLEETSLSRAESGLRAGRLDLVVVDARRLLVDAPIASTDTSSTALLARAVSSSLSLEDGLEAAGIPPGQAARLANPAPLPIGSLQPAHHKSTAKTTVLYGLILTYVLLSQYGTWLIMGIVEEKSSRVIEVLLSTLRPGQLLFGKVLGIGIVAFLQSALIVATAIGLGAAVGSDLLHGSAPLDVLAILVWVVLGYAFYCWVYAAGGSLADRQAQVQSLAFPLQLPILFGYIVSLTSLGQGSASTLVKVLAWLPPTAPFAMPTLLALGQATWWEFGLSVLVMIGGIVLVARVASFIYYRSILRTGGRVRLRQVLAESSA